MSEHGPGSKLPTSSGAAGETETAHGRVEQGAILEPDRINCALETFTCFECGEPIEKSTRTERDRLAAENATLRAACEAGFPTNVRDAVMADNARLRAALKEINRILTNLADLDRMVPGSRYAAHVIDARNETRAALAPPPERTNA